MGAVKSKVKTAVAVVKTVAMTVYEEAKNIATNLPPCRLVAYGYHYYHGNEIDATAALEAARDGALNIVESMPVVGLGVAVLYKGIGEEERARETIKKSLRTTAIAGAGLAVVATGGMAATAFVPLAGIAMGETIDTINGQSKIGGIISSIGNGNGQGVEALTRSVFRNTLTCLGDIGVANSGAKFYNKVLRKDGLKPNSTLPENVKEGTMENKGDLKESGSGQGHRPKGEQVYCNKEANTYTKIMPQKDAANYQFAAEEGIGVNCKRLPDLPDGKACVVMEGGSNLKDALKSGKITRSSAFSQLKEIQGKMKISKICHGDIKPSNVTVLSNGQLRLIDNGDVACYKNVSIRRPLTYPGNTSIPVESHVKGYFGPGTDIQGFESVRDYIADESSSVRNAAIGNIAMWSGIAALLKKERNQ